MEYECIVNALVYVRRLIKCSRGDFFLLKDNWKAVFLTCCVLSNKVWDDFHMRNLDYCYVFKGLSLERMNALERQLLILIDNRCNVSPTAYAQIHSDIQGRITSSSEGKSKKENIHKKRLSKASKIHPGTTKSENRNKDVSVVDNTDNKQEESSPDMVDRADSSCLSVSESSSKFALTHCHEFPAMILSDGESPMSDLPKARKSFHREGSKLISMMMPPSKVHCEKSKPCEKRCEKSSKWNSITKWIPCIGRVNDSVELHVDGDVDKEE